MVAMTSMDESYRRSFPVPAFDILELYRVVVSHHDADITLAISRFVHSLQCGNNVACVSASRHEHRDFAHSSWRLM